MVVDDKPLPNRYDPYQIKGKLDEYIIDYLSKQRDFPVNNRYSNTKIVLGLLATCATIWAHIYEYIYNKPFPANYLTLLVCVIIYFTFNFAYQYVDYLVCGDIYFTSNPSTPEYAHIAEFSIESTIPRFTPIYKTAVYLYLKSAVALSKTEKWNTDSGTYRVLRIDVNVETFFNSEGYLIPKPVTDLADRLLKAMQKAS
jgi:hypothetical protein